MLRRALQPPDLSWWNEPEWALKEGEDFGEQLVVGTAGKVKNMLLAFKKQRKPYIDPRDVRVLVLDEADNIVQAPPLGR